MSVEVIRWVNGSPYDPVLINQTDSACTGGQGWYSDAHWQVTLCDATCASLHEDYTPTIVVYFICDTSSGL